MAPGGTITCSTLSCACYLERGTGDPCVCDDRSTVTYVTVATSNTGRSEVVQEPAAPEKITPRWEAVQLRVPPQPEAVKLRARMMLLCIRKGNR